MPYGGAYDEGGELGPGYFVEHQVRSTWYEYKEPGDAASDHVLLEAVPAMVYSE